MAYGTIEVVAMLGVAVWAVGRPSWKYGKRLGKAFKATGWW